MKSLQYVLALMVLCGGVSSAYANAPLTLGIPGPNTTVSGIGVMSGWACAPTSALTARFDGGDPVPLSYGSRRPDTEPVCGDTDNGFVAIWNWGTLTPGNHEIVLYDGTEERARATFTVASPGVEVLRGQTGEGRAVLANGQRATLQWSQAEQRFVAQAYSEPIDYFVGSWTFTNDLTTQTYHFADQLYTCGEYACLPHIDPAAPNLMPTVWLTVGSITFDFDDTFGDTLDREAFILHHQDGPLCREYWIDPPYAGEVVQARYSQVEGECDDLTVYGRLVDTMFDNPTPTVAVRAPDAE